MSPRMVGVRRGQAPTRASQDPKKGGDCADPEASWGHRRGKGPGQKDELFFGCYFSLATMVKDEDRDAGDHGQLILHVGGQQTPR